MKHGMISTFALLCIVLIETAQAQTAPGYQYMWGDWGWGHMIFGSLMMVLFWGGIIVAVVLLFRRVGGGSTGAAAPPSSTKTALEILKERFARGDIDKEEFEERKRLLSD